MYRRYTGYMAFVQYLFAFAFALKRWQSSYFLFKFCHAVHSFSDIYSIRNLMSSTNAFVSPARRRLEGYHSEIQNRITKRQWQARVPSPNSYNSGPATPRYIRRKNSMENGRAKSGIASSTILYTGWIWKCELRPDCRNQSLISYTL